MRVIDHEPWAWFLLESDGELLLDVHINHGPLGGTLLMALDDAERAAFDREGRAYVSRLASTIQQSAPMSAGTRSPYRERDLGRKLDSAVARAVRTWREAGASRRRPSS